MVGRDTLLGGTIKRVKLDDGSYLNVLDDSDLADFIKHHAWFEGDEVALPREDRMYLLGNLTGQTPKKRRVTQSQSDLKVLNATCSFPVETEQHELDPDCNGADEMVTDETPLQNENGDDDETIVQKPLTSSQKKVIQNIHNNLWTSEQGGVFESSSAQSCPTGGSSLCTTRVRVSGVCSQRASSKTQVSSSVATDFPFQ